MQCNNNAIQVCCWPVQPSVTFQLWSSREKVCTPSVKTVSRIFSRIICESKGKDCNFFFFFVTIKSSADDLINENKVTFKSQLLRTHGGTLKRPSVQPEVLNQRYSGCTNKHLIREAILSWKVRKLWNKLLTTYSTNHFARVVTCNLLKC